MTVASTSVCGSEAAPPGLLFVVKALKWSVCLNFKTQILCVGRLSVLLCIPQ